MARRNRYPSDPMANAYPPVVPYASKQDFVVAGIICSVYGLAELPAEGKDIACVYLLHGRGGNRQSMEGMATTIVSDWNKRLQQKRVAASMQATGLIAVCIDQRNHGSRLIDARCNNAWDQGNPTHAQDMFTIYNGTARDVTSLIDHLGIFVFPLEERRITKNLVAGTSLGSHAAWHCLLHESRIRAGVNFIGCPDYTNLMSERAKNSKIPDWTNSDPPGSKFLGSKSYPQGLLDLTKVMDPAGLFFSQMDDPSLETPIRKGPVRDPTYREIRALRPIAKKHLAGKRLLNFFGADDRLVPHHASEPFLTWFEKAIAPGGWCSDMGISFKDVIVPGAGHEVTPPMVAEAVRFLGDQLASGEITSGPSSAGMPKL